VVDTNHIGQEGNGQQSSLDINMTLTVTVTVTKDSGRYTSLYLYN